MRDSLDLLRDKYPDSTLLPLKTALKEIGLSAQTGYNRLSTGKGLPFPVSTQGKNRVVHLLDLADYLDSLRVVSSSKRRRGRPTKAARLAAAAEVSS